MIEGGMALPCLWCQPIQSALWSCVVRGDVGTTLRHGARNSYRSDGPQHHRRGLYVHPSKNHQSAGLWPMDSLSASVGHLHREAASPRGAVDMPLMRGRQGYQLSRRHLPPLRSPQLSLPYERGLFAPCPSGRAPHEGGVGSRPRHLMSRACSPLDQMAGRAGNSTH